MVMTPKIASSIRRGHHGDVADQSLLLQDSRKARNLSLIERSMSYIRPNYDVAREKAGFSWQVSGSYLSCVELSGIPVKYFYTRPAACIEV